MANIISYRFNKFGRFVFVFICALSADIYYDLKLYYQQTPDLKSADLLKNY